MYEYSNIWIWIELAIVRPRARFYFARFVLLSKVKSFALIPAPHLETWCSGAWRLEPAPTVRLKPSGQIDTSRRTRAMTRADSPVVTASPHVHGVLGSRLVAGHLFLVSSFFFFCSSAAGVRQLAWLFAFNLYWLCIFSRRMHVFSQSFSRNVFSRGVLSQNERCFHKQKLFS